MICSVNFLKSQVNPKAAGLKIIRQGGPIEETFQVSICQQCSVCESEQVCPTGALSREKETGVIILDSEKCVSCGICIEACKYQAVFRNPEANFPIICNLCFECVQICPTKALTIADK
jgi:Fe-S-cluster-containing dehydrogenase component